MPRWSVVVFVGVLVTWTHARANPQAANEAPAPISLAVFNVNAKTGVEQATADLITESALAEVKRYSGWKLVIGPREITLRVSPQEQQMLYTCAQDECALVDAELAGALGVTHMLVGSVGKLGGSYIVAMKVLDLRSGLSAAEATRRIKGDTDETLVDAVPELTHELMRKMGLEIPAVATERPAKTPSTATPSKAPLLMRVVAGVALAGSAPVVLVALAIVGAGLGWALVAFNSASVARLIPAPSADPTARVMARVGGPAVVAFGVGAAALLAAALLAGVGLASAVASFVVAP